MVVKMWEKPTDLRVVTRYPMAKSLTLLTCLSFLRERVCCSYPWIHFLEAYNSQGWHGNSIHFSNGVNRDPTTLE